MNSVFVLESLYVCATHSRNFKTMLYSFEKIILMHMWVEGMYVNSDNYLYTINI